MQTTARCSTPSTSRAASRGDVLQWQTEGGGHKGNSQLAVFDATGDGKKEVLFAQGTELRVHSGITGALLGKSNKGWYGPSASAPFGARVEPIQVDDDAALEFRMVFGSGQPKGFFGVYELSETYKPVLLWQQYVAHPILAGPTADLDGDGKLEVVMSVFEIDDGRWYTRVYDGATGKLGSQLKDWVTSQVALDVQGDGKSEVVVRHAPQKTLSDLSNVQLAHLGSAGFVPWWAGGVTGATVAAGVDRYGDGNDELLVYRDLDGDGVHDVLQLLEGGSGKALIAGSYTFPKSHSITYKLSADHMVEDGPDQVLIYSSDGYFDVLTDELAHSGNRVRLGGFGPAVLAASLAAGQPKQAVVKDSVGRTILVDLASGSAASPPEHKTLLTAKSNQTVHALIDVDGDGDKEILTHELGPGASALLLLDSDGQQLWRFEKDGMEAGVHTGGVGAGGDLDGDGTLDFYLMGAVYGVLVGLPVSGKTGKQLDWEYAPSQPGGGYGTAYSPALLLDADGDGDDDVLVSHYGDLAYGAASGPDDVSAPFHILDGKTGAVLASSVLTGAPAYMTVAELDGVEDTYELLVSWWNGNGAMALNPPAMGALWSDSLGGVITKGAPMAVDIDGDAKDDLVAYEHISGRIRAYRGHDGAPLWVEGGVVSGERQLANGRIYKVLAAGGFEDVEDGSFEKTLAAQSLNQRSLAVTDLTGNGHPSALYADRQGRLYCVDLVEGDLDWVLELGFQIATVIAANVDDDPEIELLLTALDGNLHAIDQSADVGTVAVVNDGLTGDEDSVTTAAGGISYTSFAANWTAATGGTQPLAGYLVRLLTESGALVLDWQDAGMAETFESDLVALVPGVTYQVMVMPYGDEGGGEPVLSDGFWLGDIDGDNVLDPDEEALGTDPESADSDGDGLDDGTESKRGKDIDTDGDGIIDALDLDSDGDGLPDAEEGLKDSDNDGRPDFQDADDDNDGIATSKEVADAETFGADPDADGTPSWLDTDSDGDGLPDLEEGTLDADGDGNPNYLDSDGRSSSSPFEPWVGPQVMVAPCPDEGCSSAPVSPGSGPLLVVLLGLLGLIRRRLAV